MERSKKNGVSPIARLVAPVTAPFRALFSKQAQRAYLSTLLFAGMSIYLLFVAAVVYWTFYFNFIPQLGVERLIYLQFGDADPWGTALLGSELASLQAYDVSVKLQLPRTPSNLDVGNFMLNLALFSRSTSPTVTGSNTSTYVIAQSRRPAILTYASPMVDTAQRFTRMPLYIVGWQREAETLEVGMMESIEFARGRRNLPGSLRLEIQSGKPMQVYSTVVRFKARFTGLRWIMYNWRISSFLVFTSMFWGVSMISTSIAWLFLPSRLRVAKGRPKRNIKMEDDDHKQVKREHDDLKDYLSAEDLMEGQQTFSDDSKVEEEQVLKEEEEPDPMHGEEGIGTTEADTTSSGIIGTSLDARSYRGMYRRRIPDRNQGG